MTDITKKLLLTLTAAKGLLLIATALVLVGAGCAKAPVKRVPPSVPSGVRPAPGTPPMTSSRVEDATFKIGSDSVTLKGGVAESAAAEGSASKVVTRIFGEPLAADVNGDGVKDAIVMLQQSTGGSGLFYYVAVAMNGAGIYRGSAAALLGDRIAPQPLEFRDGLIIANYADRKPGEPMTAQPSVGVSRYFGFQGGSLKETKKP